MPENLPWLAVAVLIVALLYSSVGHAGASGYLAVMALFSLAPEVIKPTALVLNVLVAGIGTWHFWRAGHFSWRLFWPLAVLAVPLAFVGGYAHLPAPVFKILLGVVLLFSALRFLIRPAADEVAHEPARPVAFALGGGLGLLAGLFELNTLDLVGLPLVLGVIALGIADDAFAGSARGWRGRGKNCG